MLGDDALACLKDLKKWLRLHDEKANRLDVARCLAEANLVKGDLLEILAEWPEAATEDKLKSKIALACLELLVPLTWPIEKNDTQMTVNHHRHVPYLQLAQTSYKRAILDHESATVLRTAVRIGLPSIALPMGERSSRDEGIIKLLLYFLRNVAMISSPQNLPNEGKESEVSRSATIEAFHRQDVLALLLTISSNMGEDFNTQDIVIMEVLFHLLKGVDVERLFMDKKQLNSKNDDELKSLLTQEAGMHRSYAKNAPTRHNRFGTMIWVKRDEAGKVSTVSGQDVLKDGQRTLSKMDQTKKWNKPRQRVKNEEPAYDRFDMPVPLTESANTHLRAFVEELLDSSFNPLFNHIRRAIEREAERVLDAHHQQFFYLVSWFLEAERVRRRKKKEVEKRKKDKKLEETFEADSFALIATVLNQETFILLNRFMQDRLDLKSWREVQAGMRCFTQILLIVQDMAESPLEEDQEIAENIQNRIFYEETTHDRIVAILRGYKDQGFGYLNSCTELSHVFLRILERYSRENVDLQVRSRRRARKSRKAASKQREQNEDDGDEASEMEDVAEAERVTRERKFNFTRFSTKFTTQACINTFVAFAKYYTDLDTEQLKRAHRFFYRVAFKQDLSVILFRLDIIALFNKMIKGPEGLDPANPMFREWDELVRQIFKKMIKKLEQRPELLVELLFSKINATTYYLEYGYEKQTTSSRPRPPAVLEVRGSMTVEEQIGVVVAALYDDKLEQVDWVSRIILSAAEERQSWESEALARQAQSQSRSEPDPEKPAEQPETISKAPSIIATPDTDSLRSATFKEARLRLLMTLSGMERLGIEDEPNATWIIPSSLTSAELRHTHDTIEQHRKNPVFEYGDEDPLSAKELLRRKPAEKAKKVEYDDDSEDDGMVSDSDADNDFLHPFSGPVDRPNAHHKALDALKAKRRKRRHSNPVNELDDETLEARRKARHKADLEKAGKVKSTEFVRDSDDDSDEERDRTFFAKEELRRKGQGEKIREAFAAGRVKKNIEGAAVTPTAKGTRKRKSPSGEEGERKKRKKKADSDSSDDRSINDDDDDDDMATDNTSSSPARSANPIPSETEDEPTPLSSPPLEHPSLLSSKATARLPPLQARDCGTALAMDAEDDDDIWASTARRRGARVVAVLDDSDDE